MTVLVYTVPEVHARAAQTDSNGGLMCAEECVIGGAVWMFNINPKARREDEEHDDFIARMIARHVPPFASSQVVVLEDAQIPGDRTFRNALRLSVGALGFDMTKCRSEHRRHMRIARAPKLKALDIAYQRADEAVDAAEKQRIAALKQTLRDVTALPAIESAQTPEELKAVWPDCLR